MDKRLFRQICQLILLGAAIIWLLGSMQLPAGTPQLLWGLIFPFFLGFILAFLLNLPMKKINEKLLKGRGGKANPLICLLLALFLFIFILVLLVLLLLPGLTENIRLLGGALPDYLQQAKALLEPYIGYFPGLEKWLDAVEMDWQSLAGTALGLLQNGSIGNIFSSFASAAGSFFSGIASFAIALVFALNLLLGKKRWLRQLTGFAKAYTAPQTFLHLQQVAQLASQTFAKYVAGQCTEALIIGTAIGLMTWIGRFPYPLLVAVLTAITAFIPLFGAYIAWAVGVFLVLASQGFWRAVIFTLLFIIIQQIDGDFIYPKVVGNSVGLSPGWILIAVTVGGGLFGVGGILFFIPLLSVVYKLLYSDAHEKLKQKYPEKQNNI